MSNNYHSGQNDKNRQDQKQNSNQRQNPNRPNQGSYDQGQKNEKDYKKQY